MIRHIGRSRTRRLRMLLQITGIEPTRPMDAQHWRCIAHWPREILDAGMALTESSAGDQEQNRQRRENYEGFFHEFAPEMKKEIHSNVREKRLRNALIL